MKTSLLLLAAFCGPASAQSGGPWSITSSTLDGGGTRSTGGAWTLTGTIGQPDAAAAKSTGGTYAAQGGFWPGVVSAPGDPLLTLSPASPATITIAWSAAAAGYQLQYSTNLQAWTNQGSPITGASSIPWPAGPGTGRRYFFRLIRP